MSGEMIRVSMATTLLVAVIFASSMPSSALAQGALPMQVCDVVHGFASEYNYTWSIVTGTASFDLRKGEAVIFVLRGLAVDAGLPKASIHADMVIGGVKSTAVSDPITGVLTLLQSLSATDSLTITVANDDPLHSTPFAMYSFHANHPTCTIRVAPRKIFAATLIPSIRGLTNTPATMYFKLLPVSSQNNYKVNIFNGGADVTGAVCSGSCPNGDWTTTPTANGIQGTTAGTGFGFVSFTPLPSPPPGQQQSDVLSFNVQWNRSSGTRAPVVPLPTTPPGQTTSPSAAGTGPTQASGSGTQHGSGDELARTTTTSTLGSIFLFACLVTLAYFIARTAYNISQGERRFPRYVPHHEEIGTGVGAMVELVQRGVAGANARSASMSTRRTEYEDIPGEEGSPATRPNTATAPTRRN